MLTEFERMLRLLDQSWHLRSQIVPCLVGPPGIGKTAAVRQHALSHGTGRVVKIVASRCVPSETVGMTMPDHKNHGMVIYNSSALSSLKDGDILFLDELLEADQFVLSTLLTVIESRELADGTPLPDIQIVAATNETISSQSLKLNIRQRFLFQSFDMDTSATWDYIFEETGFRLDRSLLQKLRTEGPDYNVLTPRSLTKLCLWMDSVPADDIKQLARVINDIWGNSLGTEIANARRRRDQAKATPEEQVREAINRMVVDGDISMSKEELTSFNDATLGDMLAILQACSDWDTIASKLETMSVEEEEEENIPDIEF